MLVAQAVFRKLVRTFENTVLTGFFEVSKACSCGTHSACAVAEKVSGKNHIQSVVTRGAFQPMAAHGGSRADKAYEYKLGRTIVEEVVEKAYVLCAIDLATSACV